MSRSIRSLALLACLVLCWSAAAPLRAADASPPAWLNLGEGVGQDRPGGVLLWAAEMKKAVWLGPAGERPQPCVRLYEPPGTWEDLCKAGPERRFNPYYQAVLDPAAAAVWCLNGGQVLYRFDLNEKTWSALPPAPQLEGLSWHAMAGDAAGKLVVVGSDKKAGNIGWTRTAIYDLAASAWSLLPLPADEIVQAHRDLVALTEAMIDLGGYTRLAWYRDAPGEGTAQERAALLQRAGELKRTKQAGPYADALDGIARLIEGKQLLAALKATRALQRQVELAAEAQYPVPCSRRNSPLAYDPALKAFVLFGGDHEDYLMNDTWVLDLARGWRRMQPRLAPSPRAGHALISLPGGGVGLYEGYVQTTSTDYGARSYKSLDTTQFWRYDGGADRWDLLAAWPLPAKESDPVPPPVGHFYDYACEYFAAPQLVPAGPGRLLLLGQPGRTHFLPHRKWPSRMWALNLSPRLEPDPAGADKLGQPPNQRLYRGGPFQADFCEVGDEPKPTGLADLPDNRWVRLSDPPRNPLYGCRQRDWGTAVWDSDREQILHWGGGHCVRSASAVAHYSPVSGRVVEGIDADEPYNTSGGGGFDSSVMNRPWVGTHNYNHYGYDPKCKLLVSGRGYLYDPSRMDWLRIERIKTPFRFTWGHCVVEGSAHGAVAWAPKDESAERANLFLYDRQAGWSELDLGGPKHLFAPYCDSHGMVYDAKRDRMVLGGVDASYGKTGSGKLLVYDFAQRRLSPLEPDNLPAGRARNFREMAYIDHADWILIGSHLRVGDREKGKPYTRVYDCQANRYFLLEAGEVADGHSCGWMYDARRKLAYVYNYRGQAWAMKINPATARRLEKAE